MNVIYENIFKFISKHLHQYMRFVHYYANNLIYTDNFFNSAFSWGFSFVEYYSHIHMFT